MEKIVRQGMLYDVYGKLLTKRQRQIYEDVVYGDLSLSEVGDMYDISRQGVHEHIKRCDKILENYENTLHIIRNSEKISELAKRAEALVADTDDNPHKDIILGLLGQIMEISTDQTDNQE